MDGPLPRGRSAPRPGTTRPKRTFPVAVTWTVASGGGSVSPASATTGADGQASTGWTLGPSIGTQGVEASTPGAGSVRFEATATAGAPSLLALVTQPSGSAQVGVPFDQQPVVEVRDAAGQPLHAPRGAVPPPPA